MRGSRRCERGSSSAVGAPGNVLVLDYRSGLPKDCVVNFSSEAGLALAIYFAAMAHRDDQHHDPFLLNFTDDSVIPDSVSPESLPGVAQRLAKALGIVGGSNPRLHVVQGSLLGYACRDRPDPFRPADRIQLSRPRFFRSRFAVMGDCRSSSRDSATSRSSVSSK